MTAIASAFSRRGYLIAIGTFIALSLVLFGFNHATSAALLSTVPASYLKKHDILDDIANQTLGVSADLHAPTLLGMPSPTSMAHSDGNVV
jgi:hypothetical protein